MDLTDEQWQIIEQIIAAPAPDHRGRGRPPRDARAVLDAILWKIRTRGKWDDLPACYPSQQTCRRYAHAWKESGSLNAIMTALIKDLAERGGLDILPAIRRRDIRFVEQAETLYFTLPPGLNGTWQASTASVILQSIIKRLNDFDGDSDLPPGSVWNEL